MGLPEYMKAQMGKGAMVGRAKGSDGPFSAPYRDIGNCLSMLLAAACDHTKAVYEDREKEIEILDTIVKMYLKVYVDCRKNNMQGLSNIKELYDYLDGVENGHQVYSTFTAAFLQSVFCYLFTVRELAIGLPDSLDQEAFEHNVTLQLLSSLSEEVRPGATKDLLQAGYWKSTIDHSKLLRTLDPFLEIIKEQQAKQYKEAEDGSKEEE